MHAILIDPDKRLTWSEVPDPIAKADEVLIEIHAAALNRAASVTEPAWRPGANAS